MHPRNLMNINKLHASKARGQNFLTQPATAKAIAVSAGIKPNDTVVEIGAGLGALTMAAAGLAAKVVALEIDRGVFEVLGRILAEKNITNVHPRLQDALKADWQILAGEAGSPLVIIGNLPYNITSPLLFNLMQARQCWRSATVMVQREVAARLSAKPGGKQWGRLGVMVQTHCEVKQGMVLGRKQFFPEPKVESQVVHLDVLPKPRSEAAAQNPQWFNSVVKAAFSQRRKTVANALAAGLGLERSAIADALKEAGIDPGLRAERLGIADLDQAAKALSNLAKMPDNSDA